MSPESRSVEITLLGRQFRVACPAGEEKQLLASVEYLDKQMREIRDSGKVMGNERIAIMAALNIAHELLTLKSTGFDINVFRRRISAMEATLEKNLAEQDKLI
jgi:cell division protein ZapA